MYGLPVVINALSLLVQASLPILLVVLVAAILGGFLQSATQLEERALGFFAKLFGLGVFIYLSSDTILSQILGFTQRIWGGADFYRF